MAATVAVSAANRASAVTCTLDSLVRWLHRG